MRKMGLITLAVLFLQVGYVFAQSAMAIEKATVNDLDVSVPFYQNLIGFEKIGMYSMSRKKFNRLVGIINDKLSVKGGQLQLGEETIELHEFENDGDAIQTPSNSKISDLWYQHMAFVVGDIGRASIMLGGYWVTHISITLQMLLDYITESGGVKAFNFQDSDKHNIELIHFLKGKGDTKCQKEKGQVFVGIDHSAIGISDTDRATSFYAELLGPRTKGHSENYGPEQELLNQVFGARLWNSGLRAKKGIGVKFLEYIAPPGRRDYLETNDSTDLWHWYTTVSIPDIERTYSTMREAVATSITKGTITLGNKKKFMVRHADGYAELIT